MPYHRIITPEQVYFRYEIGGLASRVMAWFVDQLFILILYAAVVLLTGWLAGFLGMVSSLSMASWVAAIAFVGLLAIDFGYYAFFELRWGGQSPGKRIMNLRVISTRGTRLRFAEVVIRNVVRWIDNTIIFIAFIGAAVAFIDPLHRRLGDLAADTIVIRDSKLSLPSALLRQQSRVNTFQTDTAIRNRILSRVTRDERDLIFDLMMRRDELDPAVREDLFASAAKLFRQRYALPEDMDYLSDEQTVMNLGLVVQNMTFTS